MFEKAIDKLRDEMAAKHNNAYVGYIGEYLTNYLREHPSAAAAIIKDGKTIEGSLKAMEDYARKQQRSGNCAVVTPEDGLRIVSEHFGLQAARPEPKQTRAASDELDLDALLNQ